MENPECLNEREQIAIIAHRIYEEEGSPDGRAEEHWARAERVVHEQRMGVEPSREGVSAEALEPPSQMVP